MHHGMEVVSRNMIEVSTTPSPIFRHLIYSGQLELGDSHRPAAVRTSTVATCTHNLPEFLRELGFMCVLVGGKGNLTELSVIPGKTKRTVAYCQPARGYSHSLVSSLSAPSDVKTEAERLGTRLLMP